MALPAARGRPKLACVAVRKFYETPGVKHAAAAPLLLVGGGSLVRLRRQTRANMRAIVNHARRGIGITVPPGVEAIHERIHHSRAIRNAAKIMRDPPGWTTHASMITEMLDGNFLPIPPLNSDVSEVIEATKIIEDYRR